MKFDTNEIKAAAQAVKDHWDSDKDLNDTQQQNLIDLGDVAASILFLLDDYADLNLALQEKGSMALRFYSRSHALQREVDSLCTQVLRLKAELKQCKEEKENLRAQLR